jgi:hypothetical protein
MPPIPFHITLTIGYAVFQVHTIDLVAADPRQLAEVDPNMKPPLDRTPVQTWPSSETVFDGPKKHSPLSGPDREAKVTRELKDLADHARKSPAQRKNRSTFLSGRVDRSANYS